MSDAQAIRSDFDYGASPGGDWPPIMGSQSEEAAAGGTGGGTTGSSSAPDYILAYLWEVD